MFATYFASVKKVSFAQVLDCKLSQTFQPQSGAASRRLTVHAAFHLFFTDAKYVANILAPEWGCFQAPHRARRVPSFFH